MQFLVVALLVGMLSGAACACSIYSPSPDEIVAKAHSIFLARITEVRVVQATTPRKKIAQEMLEAKFDLKEQVQGSPPQSHVVRSQLWQPGECGAFFLLVGDDYVLVLDRADDVFLSGSSFVVAKDIPASGPRLESIRQIVHSQKRNPRKPPR